MIICTNGNDSKHGHESHHAPDEAVEKLRGCEAQQEEANADFDKHDADDIEWLVDKVKVKAIG
jgi:hypothetical protein